MKNLSEDREYSCTLQAARAARKYGNQAKAES
jgi:hypothetical protein